MLPLVFLRILERENRREERILEEWNRAAEATVTSYPNPSHIQIQTHEQPEYLNLHGRPVNIHLAAIDGDLAKLKQIVEEEGVSVNTTDDRGWTPLMIGIGARQVNIIEYLKKKKANADLQNSEGQTALFIASRYGFVEAVHILTTSNFFHSRWAKQVDLADSCGSTPLMQAICSKNQEIAEMLLREASANKMKRDQNGDTALLIAVQNENYDAVKSILDRCFYNIREVIDTKNYSLQTSIAIASLNNSNSILNLLQERRKRGVRVDWVVRIVVMILLLIVGGFIVAVSVGAHMHKNYQ